jgi:hypothetical protein
MEDLKKIQFQMKSLTRLNNKTNEKYFNDITIIQKRWY